MIYVFDIDGTICTKAIEFDYEGSEPIRSRIQIINRLYDQGHTIIFQTARGMGRFNNDAEQAINTFYDMTVKQLNEWGVKYHQLFLGKPAGDIYIDDKGMRDVDYFNQMEKM
jgi:hydroxymethylpyrimidine pyrophosphatase-like HAD family hydrolase